MISFSVIVLDSSELSIVSSVTIAKWPPFGKQLFPTSTIGFVSPSCVHCMCFQVHVTGTMYE